jgi:hypothetical protein
MNPAKQQPETNLVATPSSNSRLNIQTKNINYVQRNIKRAGQSRDKVIAKSHRENLISAKVRNMVSPQLVNENYGNSSSSIGMNKKKFTKLR